MRLFAAIYHSAISNNKDNKSEEMNRVLDEVEGNVQLNKKRGSKNKMGIIFDLGGGLFIHCLYLHYSI